MDARERCQLSVRWRGTKKRERTTHRGDDQIRSDQLSSPQDVVLEV